MSSRLDQVINEAKTILAQCIIAANQAAEAAAAIGTAGLAPLASPAFTGIPTAPTPAASDASLQIANTSWIAAKFGAASGIATLDFNGLVPLTQLPFAGLTFDGTWDANANSPTLVSGSGVSGHFRVVAVAGSTNLNGITTWNVGDWALFSGSAWSRVPYTAPPITNLPLSALAGIANNTFVGNTMGGSAAPSAISIASIASFMPTMIGATGSLGGSVGFVPAPSLGDQTKALFGDGTWKTIPLPDLSAYALLNSPAFTGTATVATQARGLSSTAIASTAFVIAQLAAAADGVPIVNGTTANGTSTYGARIDHIHPTDTSRAAALNPSTAGSFTHNGTLTVNGTASITAISTANETVNGSLTVNGTLTVNGSAISPSTTIATPVEWRTATGTATITIPSGATKCRVTLIGGGGGAVTNSGNFCGGGGGATLFKLLTGLLAGSTLSLTVGVAGTSNLAGSQTNGGDTILSSGTQSITTLTAHGGGAVSGAGGNINGTGGTATNGDVNTTGSGGATLASADALGGTSLMGTPGTMVLPRAATGFGSGATNGAGGSAATAGAAIFEWFA